MISLSDVSLERRMRDDRSRDLKRTVIDLARGRYAKPETRMVLKHISLEVGAGERVGVIGANGAGKSTLLSIIAGVLKPTSGVISIRGSVAPLIELGAGFDPDLSVFKNVMLYGVLLGSSRERMFERASDIIAFAELNDYSHALVKTLSAGMVARLGFAVAADVEPDILLLDEVFAVGDERFKKRSRSRIEALWARGTASIIVSHDLGLIIETCDRAICMGDGRIAFNGLPRAATRFYSDAIDTMGPGSVS